VDPFLIFLTVVISILSFILVVVGIQVILLLRHVNKTLHRLNQTIDYTQNLVHNLSNPLTDLKALGQGVKTGLHVAEHVVTWVKNKKQTPTDQENE